jgi:hypothetical protein
MQGRLPELLAELAGAEPPEDEEAAAAGLLGFGLEPSEAVVWVLTIVAGPGLDRSTVSMPLPGAPGSCISRATDAGVRAAC